MSFHFFRLLSVNRIVEHGLIFVFESSDCLSVKGTCKLHEYISVRRSLTSQQRLVCRRHFRQVLDACLVFVSVAMASLSDQSIVVGGGLAGMSAANTVPENGGSVLLLDKSFFCGGNSTKATSGINGANTRTQRDKGIKDSAELFTSDTLKGGAKKPELAKVLCENSGADVEWLMDKFNLDLSLVARLGGHSAPRTHQREGAFPWRDHHLCLDSDG